MHQSKHEASTKQAQRNRSKLVDQCMPAAPEGRFCFYESYGMYSPFYQKVAKPLLSMRTVGSIDVERRIKPLKHDIITKQRNRLKDPKGIALYRASENLMKAKQTLGMKMNDSLLSKVKDHL